MPLLKSSYQAKFPFSNAHFNTIFRTIFTNLQIDYNRERLELKDGDFIDLDFSRVQSNTLAILLHGLEGSSNSKYILALAKKLNAHHIDVLSVNFRGCSGVSNRLPQTYHSGKSEDLKLVIDAVIKNHTYDKIAIVGYSMGGNITMKYLGEQGIALSEKICCAFAISAPCDLAGSSNELSKSRNVLYMNRFLKTLKLKTLEKLSQFPEIDIDKIKLLKIKDFKDFDTLFTAPMNGFSSAEDYWEKASSFPYLKNIGIPTLLLNALDDTFLSDSCYPYEIAKNHKFLHLETPKHGGHVGFNQYQIGKNNTWLEDHILGFIKKNS
jgi:predicted alpha/beta-fold hydrolase